MAPMKLIFGMQLTFILTTRTVERENWKYFKVIFQISILRFSSIIKQARGLIYGMQPDFNIEKLSKKLKLC